MRTSKLTEALFPEVRTRLLAAIMRDADREWYLSELAAFCGLRPSSLQREVAMLARVGILAMRRSGNRIYYRANRENPIFPELQSLMTKTAGVRDVVLNALENVTTEIRLAFVFGSIAAGKETSVSDLDLMVIGDVSLEDLDAPISEIASRTNRIVNLVAYDVAEFREKVNSGNHFLTTVLRNEKMFIIGSERDLEAALERGESSAARDQPKRTGRSSGVGRKKPR